MPKINSGQCHADALWDVTRPRTHSVSRAASILLADWTGVLIPRREDAAKPCCARRLFTLSRITSKCTHIGHSCGEARRVPRLAGIMLVTLISQPHLGLRRVIACLVWMVGWVSGIRAISPSGDATASAGPGAFSGEATPHQRC